MQHISENCLEIKGIPSNIQPEPKNNAGCKQAWKTTLRNFISTFIL